MLGRNKDQTTSEAPGFIDAAVWFDLGPHRQQLVVANTQGAEGMADVPELSADQWFRAVRDKVGKTAHVVTPFPRDGHIDLKALANDPERQTYLTTEDDARDAVLAEYLGRVRQYIGSQQAHQARQAQAQAERMCPVCGAVKDSARTGPYLCAMCEAVADQQQTQDHASRKLANSNQLTFEAVREWRRDNEDRRPTKIRAYEAVSGNGYAT